MKNIFFILLALSVSVQSKAQNQLVEANNKLAIDLYQQLRSDNSNLLFSPINIDLSLLSLSQGSTGKTKEDFEWVLHLNQSVPDLVKKKFVASHNYAIDKDNQLNISNSLWIDKPFNIEADFKRTIQNTFLS
jgi:serine protease inhibitor